MKTIKPAALRRGDKIQVIAPASSFFKEAFQTGVEELSRFGWNVAYREDIFARQSYLAGSDARRAEELSAALADPAVRAILPVRGGYGLIRLLPYLKQQAAGAPPKIVIGFSDICYLHGFLQRQWGWVSVHGPMVSFGFGGEGDFRSREQLVGLLQGQRPLPLRGSEGNRRGKGRGAVFGGNLSIIAASLGTAAEVPLAGKVLLLEDWNEPLYRVDRMLNHLLQIGKFDGVAGLGFGLFGLRNEADHEYRRNFQAMASEVLAPLGVPMAFGLPFGHGRVNQPFPLGIAAEIDSDAASVSFLEQPFVEPPC